MPTTTTGTATSFITFSRASTATRINASGLVESVASGAARIDYDPVTLAAKGLLVEEQRTNLLTYSEQFDNAAWAKTNASVTANVVASPDGSTTADKMVMTGGASAHSLASATFTAASGTAYTFSCFLKAAEISSVTLSFRVAALWPGGTVQGATFNLAAGTASTYIGTPTYSITPCGNGWYRCSITQTAAAAGSPLVWIEYNINNDNQGFYVWGAQLEAGPFPSSYIPTTSASVTRSADVASVATSAFPYSATAGTLVMKATANNFPSATSGGSNPNIGGLNDGSGSNAIRVIRSAGSVDPLFRTTVAGSDVALFAPPTGSTWPNGATRAVGFAWAANDFAGCINGGTVVTDTSGALPTVNTLSIGSISSIGHLNGHIRQITYIPRRLTDAELQARTA